jgi:hypothetical protein
LYYDVIECISDHIQHCKKKVFTKVKQNSYVELNDGSYFEIGKEDAERLTNDLIYKYCYVRFGALVIGMKIHRLKKDGNYNTIIY